MRVRFQMTPWLGELLGRDELDLDVPTGTTVDDALRRLSGRVGGLRRDELLDSGCLHASVLVVVDDVLCTDRATHVLADGQIIRLMLPVAGG